jgi:hypothetical protein
MKTYAVHLRMNGKYLGCSPVPVPGQTGDDAYPVYSDRDEAGGWEAATLHVADDGKSAVAVFNDANRVLSIAKRNDGPALQSRANHATPPDFGGWELQFCASLPMQDDKHGVLCRFDDDGSALALMEIEVVQ